MKKIIIAFDGINFSEGAFEFARKLNELQPILLTGVFLPQAELEYLWSFSDVAGGFYVPISEFSETELITTNIKKFEKLCIANGIDYRVHKDFTNFALPELKKESCYADLLIIGTESFYKSIGTGSPNEYLENTLREVDCPVILVPEKFDFPESFIMAYNGSKEAVFAIKQFAYLFPEFTDKETVLVYAHDNVEKDIPDKVQIEELAARHFNKLSLLKMNLNPKNYFSKWVIEKKSAMLISGSYGRSGLSQLFKKSFVRDVIADHRLPVFIAHN